MEETSQRTVTVRREALGEYVATNERGATLRFGMNVDDGFRPVELLLAAVAGCSGIDVDVMTSRRAEPEKFEITTEATVVKNDEGNILRDIVATFDLLFPEGEDGDKARARVKSALRTAHEKTCTVSRTIEGGASVELREAN